MRVIGQVKLRLDFLVHTAIMRLPTHPDSLMSTTAIEKTAVDAAIAAAREALASDSGLDWIKMSALLERAYFWGVFSALSAIATKESEESLRRLVLETMVKTLNGRKADDSFDSTPTGKAFATLERHLMRHESNQPDPWEAIKQFADHMDRLDRCWSSGIRHARELLEKLRMLSAEAWPEKGEPETAEFRDRQRIIHDFIKSLDKIARFIALIETDRQR